MENNIKNAADFMNNCESIVIEQIMVDYAKKFQYDFSKKCKCKEENKIGETWCCNTCGLPVTKNDNLKTESNNNSVMLSAPLFEKLIEIICDNSCGTWTKGSSKTLFADEVDVHGLAYDIVKYISENYREQNIHEITNH